MSQVDLILEIGCEEIPHDLLADGIQALKTGLEKGLDGNRLLAEEVAVYGTPRRLTAIVRGIPAEQPTVEETITGPPQSATKDKDGNWTRAAEGFAAKQGVSPDDLLIVDTGRGPYVAAKRTLTGQPASEVLRTLLPEILGGIHWAKAMRWANSRGPFVRPIRWICAVLGGETVEFEFAGVKSGNQSRGHRFMAPEPFTVTDPDQYLGDMDMRKVLVDPAAREARIREGLTKAAKKTGGQVIEDQELVSITAAKTEWPVPVTGRFDDKYLEVPRQVLITSMREHQDDFAIEDKEGNLLPAFVNFADIEAADPQVIAHGNERVLRARLEDARFFYSEDRKQPLAAYAERLQSFLFQKDLGSVAEKVQRITTLARLLAEPLGADLEHAARAAELCKCDLVTGMVYEFPELQGEMGGAYARDSGEPEAVAKAIMEHYRPRFSGDALPATPEGRAVSLADKLDTICGIFGVGLIPSGSADPYALRRAAQGVVQMLMSEATGVNLTRTIESASALLAARVQSDNLADQVQNFLRDRLAHLLGEEGMRYDVVSACLAPGIGDVYDARQRTLALEAARTSDPTGFDNLMTSFRRVMKIIPVGFAGETVQATRLVDGAERNLWNAFCESRDAMCEPARPASDRLAAMAGLRPAVDAFFDSVLVMDPDENVRANRLSMLSEIRDTFGGFADFSLVVVD
ncbi:MAG: glycine--tRNA ligase subunit beta [Nitrospirota bacterium]|nr:glycine--tRNA ligase subunit beta [Nitrospirota bacterium]